MQFFLDRNIAAQTKLKNYPKEIFIPFNAGRGTGIKPKSNQEGVFSTSPASDSIKLTEWVSDRMSDGSINLPSEDVYPYYELIVKVSADGAGVITPVIIRDTFPAGTTYTWDNQGTGINRMRSNLFTDFSDYTNVFLDFLTQNFSTSGGAVSGTLTPGSTVRITGIYIAGTHSVGFTNSIWNGTALAPSNSYSNVFFRVRKLK